MIYIAFIFWMFALVCLSRGIVLMWINLIGAKAVGFVLLPGTVISELSYYLACLLSGAEFKPRKLVESEAAEKAGNDKGAKPKAAIPNPLDSGGAPYITPVLTSLLPLLSSMALIWLICKELGHPALGSTMTMSLTVNLPPIAGQTLWTLLSNQVEIMKDSWAIVSSAIMGGSGSGKISDLLMHYLIVCMVLRMAPMRLTLRQAMFGMLMFSMAASLIVAINSSDGSMFRKFWPLLTFTWGLAMLMLILTLSVRGVSALSKAFMD